MMAHRHFEEKRDEAEAEAKKKAKEVKEGEDIVETSKQEAKKPARARK